VNTKNMDIYNKTRIGDDQCGLTQDTMMNDTAVNYMLQNYYMSDMRKHIEFATSQVNVNYSAAGGVAHQCALGGANIDENGRLLHSAQTHPKAKISLLQRPYLTVPYLGRGPSNPTLEAQLQQSNSFNNRKSIVLTSEICLSNMHNYPLIPEIAETVSNPDYIVEKWTRGGDPSRKYQNSNI
jgi:hypothetical protein